jgi:PAS domain S-box-containing protein
MLLLRGLHVMTEAPATKLSELFDGPVLIDRLGESIPGLVYVFDLQESRNVYASRSLRDLLGNGADSMHALGNRLLPTIIHPDDLPLSLAHHARMAEACDGYAEEIEYRVRDASGQWRWLHSWESVLQRSGEDRPRLMLGLAQDVTPRVQAEQELRDSRRSVSESEQRWRSIVENPFDYVFVIDRSYKFTFVNFVAPGLKMEDLIGKATIFDFIAEAEHARVRAAIETVFEEGRPTSYDVYVPEYERWYSSVAGPIREGDRVTQVSILTREITAERRMEMQARKAEEQLRLMETKLAQSAKLEAVGQLAGGIAHDFNNLLTGIAGVAEILATRFGPEDPAFRDVADLRHAVERGAGLTRQLLSFSRQQPLAPTVVDMNELIEESARLLRRLIGENIELEWQKTPEPLCVRCDRSQVEQVLMNLAVNARDSMPKGGRLKIELAPLRIEDNVQQTHPDARAGDFAQLVVSDTGSGMDAAVLARIFEPFFTTKPLGSGTGLGLATVYGIVRQSGGFIQVSSELGRGTSFQIHFPRVPGLAPPALERARAQIGGSETVFLVEDEDIVLRFTRRLLESFGYRVEVAMRGDSALAMIRAGLRFDVLLTDVLLPGMDGHQLYKRAAELRPELPVVFMSGYTGNLIGERGVVAAGASFLQKPFAPDALANKLRSALDSRKCRSEPAPASARETK